MENFKLICLIYELKGIAHSMNAIYEDGGESYPSLIDDVQIKINEIVTLVEGGDFNVGK